MLLMSGIVMAVTRWVSQLHGVGVIAGAVVRQALWIAVCGGAMVAVLLQNLEPAYRLLGVDERAIRHAVLRRPAVSQRRACPGRDRRCASGTVTATDLDSMVATNGPSAARQSPGRGTPMEADDRSRLSPTPSMERIHQRASAM